jgi:hypothetical protein
VKEYQRKQLLERLDRDGSTVGRSIPERITVRGEEVDLREFVFEVKRRETAPPGERERVEAAKKNLRRERLARRREIEAGEVSFAEGERLAESVLGIDRALNALEHLEPTDLEAEASEREAADAKRWLSFVKQVLGEDAASKRGRGRS